jgi:hypothetical protein
MPNPLAATSMRFWKCSRASKLISGIGGVAAANDGASGYFGSAKASPGAGRPSAIFSIATKASFGVPLARYCRLASLMPVM